jgi:serine/threonine-protein kinase
MSHATRPDLPAPEQSGIIAGYRLDRCIGQGSAAAVYLAQDERQDERVRRRVALKVMAPELARDADFRTRMIRESRAAAALDHPHVIPVFEAGEAGGTRTSPCVTSAERSPPAAGPLARPCRADHRQIASALDAHAHGLIHRDVRGPYILPTRRRVIWPRTTTHTPPTSGLSGALTLVRSSRPEQA